MTSLFLQGQGPGLAQRQQPVKAHQLLASSLALNLKDWDNVAKRYAKGYNNQIPDGSRGGNTLNHGEPEDPPATPVQRQTNDAANADAEPQPDSGTATTAYFVRSFKIVICPFWVGLTVMRCWHRFEYSAALISICASQNLTIDHKLRYISPGVEQELSGKNAWAVAAYVSGSASAVLQHHQ